ncbi:hypothetical protein [Halarchaeum salinum]|uniref:hypothetical protein n=1 Tax=Halarchaeum salinum TaxID=489912 RepID=UPI001B886A16
MGKTEEIQLGILLVLFGGFILIDANSSLPMALEFGIMVIGLGIGVVGAIRPE